MNDLTKEALEQKLFASLSEDSAKGKKHYDFFSGTSRKTRTTFFSMIKHHNHQRSEEMAGSAKKTGLSGVELSFQKEIKPVIKN